MIITINKEAWETMKYNSELFKYTDEIRRRIENRVLWNNLLILISVANFLY